MRAKKLGASCTPQTTTIYRFDGDKVTNIKQFSGRGMKVDTDGIGLTAIYQIDEGQCNACNRRWTRVTYEWDGKTYKKIKQEETLEASQKSPW